MENISKECRLEGRRERNIQNFVSRRLKRGKYKVGQAGGGEGGKKNREGTDFLRVEYAGNTLLSGFAHTCKDNKTLWWKKSWPRAITDEPRGGGGWWWLHNSYAYIRA